MKKIAIVTASFAPISTPRANRATELAKEFAKQGCLVTVYNCTSVVDGTFNINENIRVVDLNIRKASIMKSSTKNNVTYTILDKGIILIRKLVYYFFLGSWLLYLLGLKKKLRFDDKYDLLISIGLPFTIHWGASLRIHGHNIARCYVADYGDPFSRGNDNLKCAKYFQWIEKKVIDKFDYITIPTYNAIDSYTWLKSSDCIKVIPQGFNFSEVKTLDYVPNKIPTFIYAGIFYSDIRNPKNLFDCLLKLDFDFCFIIYTVKGLQDSYSFIKPYIDKLGSKLVIYDSIPRLALIEKLSVADFLINMSNTSANQIPSKLIDYALSHRPIYSCTPNSIDLDKLISFCKGDYTGSENINLRDYDITTIVNSFFSLMQ